LKFLLSALSAKNRINYLVSHDVIIQFIAGIAFPQIFCINQNTLIAVHFVIVNQVIIDTIINNNCFSILIALAFPVIITHFATFALLVQDFPVINVSTIFSNAPSAKIAINLTFIYNQFIIFLHKLKCTFSFNFLSIRFMKKTAESVINR
jgi:hypothetical protein